MKTEIIRFIIVLGSIIAVAQSWHWHESIPLAILHGIMNWIYVIIHAIKF